MKLIFRTQCISTGSFLAYSYTWEALKLQSNE